MARVSRYHSFVVSYKTDIISVIRGHHVYSSIWSPALEETLFAFPDLREEAEEYDKFSIGIYKEKGHRALVGHIPIEISSLCFHFLNQHPSQDQCSRHGEARTRSGLGDACKIFIRHE